MASVATPPRPAKRAIGVVTKEGQTYLVEVATPAGADFYFVTPIPADYGTSFEVRKQNLAEDRDLATYHVNIGDMHDPAAVDASCDCPGFCYRGKCRHVLGLRTLVDAGKLPWPRSRSCLTEQPFVPGRSDEPRWASQRHRSAASAHRHEPEIFYQLDGNEWPVYDGDGNDAA